MTFIQANHNSINLYFYTYRHTEENPMALNATAPIGISYDPTTTTDPATTRQISPLPHGVRLCAPSVPCDGLGTRGGGERPALGPGLLPSTDPPLYYKGSLPPITQLTTDPARASCQLISPSSAASSPTQTRSASEISTPRPQVNCTEF